MKERLKMALIILGIVLPIMIVIAVLFILICISFIWVPYWIITGKWVFSDMLDFVEKKIFDKINL